MNNELKELLQALKDVKQEMQRAVEILEDVVNK